MRFRSIFTQDLELSKTESSSKSKPIVIYAEELRQFHYCKRIIYWRRIANISGSQSYLMQVGSEYHNQREVYQYQRKGDIATYKNRLFYHANLRFGAKLDVCREQERSIIAVEYKRFKHTSYPYISHILQVLLGGMAASYELAKPLIGLEIQYYQGRRIRIEPKIEWKEMILDSLQEIREMINLEMLPKPTPHKEKCRKCEYFKVCQGV